MMKHFQLALLCFIGFTNSYSQTAAHSYGRVEVAITKEKKPKRIYTKVEIKSAFPGGDSSWVQSLEKKLDQSIRLEKGAKKGKYIVSVQFVVASDTSLSDIRCLHDPGFGLCQTVLRELKKNIVWRPAPYPVRPYRKSAITYTDNK